MAGAVVQDRAEHTGGVRPCTHSHSTEPAGEIRHVAQSDKQRVVGDRRKRGLRSGELDDRAKGACRSADVAAVPVLFRPTLQPRGLLRVDWSGVERRPCRSSFVDLLGASTSRPAPGVVGRAQVGLAAVCRVAFGVGGHRNRTHLVCPAGAIVWAR